MKMFKRIGLFVAVNLLIVVTISTVTSLLGVQPYLQDKGINYQSLMVFCVLWGFGGAFISLALSRILAKWMMGVKIIDPDTREPALRDLVNRVHTLSQKAGIRVMPEVGVFEAAEMNAFATGPTKNRALVAVSTGLLANMNRDEVDGVLAHEVAHITNGDMVTMTLVQGVVNAFVMFLARVAGFFAGQAVAEERRPMVQFVTVLVLQIALGILGMMVVASFSRAREYRADAGGASLAGRRNMIAALERLKVNQSLPPPENVAAVASLQIFGRGNSFARLFSTHPELDDRIQRLKLASDFG